MLEFSSTESCTTSNTSTPLVGFSSNDSSCDGNVALMNDFESTGGCSGQGPQGPDGFSAYQIAVFNGFVGTEEEWLASLVGPVGPGVPVGGTAGQILTKIDSTNYNTFWQDNYADWTSVVKHIVKNDGTGLILKGTPVYVTGSNGTNMLVGKASNISEATSSKTMGLMQTDITTTGGTQTGFVITEGLLAGLNTAGRTAGEPIWLGPNGTLIYGLINKPYAPAHLVFIGIVTKVSAGNGEVFVKIQNGFELKEIHDVDVITTTPVNGDVLGFNGSLWVNKTIPNWLGYTPFNLPSLTSGSVLFSNGTTLAQDNANFFWDDTNNRLGIGTATPISTLDVNGQVSIRNGLNFFKATTNIVGSYNADASNYQDLLIKANSYDFSIGAVNKLFISSAGNVGIGTSTFVGSIKLAVNGQIGGPTYSSTYLDVTGAIPELRGNSGIGYYSSVGNHTFYGGSSVEYMRLTTAGLLGIGTTSPVSKLHIGTAPVASTNYGTLSIGGGAFNGSTAGYFIGSVLGTSLAINEVSGYGGNLLDLQVAGVTKLKVDTTGSIFYQTSSASGLKWDNLASIMFNGQDQGIVVTPYATNYVGFSVKGRTSQTYDLQQWQNSIGTVLAKVTASGNIGIGTTPTTLLDVGNSATGIIRASGRIQVGSAASTASGTYSGVPQFFAGNNTNDTGVRFFSTTTEAVMSATYASTGAYVPLSFYTSDSVRMTILQNGNVGIGTVNPLAKLEVFGTGKTVIIGDGTGATDTYIDLQNNRGQFGFEAATGVRFQGTGSRPIVFGIGSWGTGEVVRIATTGCFGIGNNNPLARLDILDTVLAGSAALAGSVLNLAQTWNTTGVPTALLLNVTDTASNGSSKLFDFQVGGLSQLTLFKDGRLQMKSNTALNSAGNSVILRTNLQGGTGYNLDVASYNNFNTSSLAQGFANFSGNIFYPAGTGVFKGINVTYTINNPGVQTGTATGIFLNATETALNGMVHNLMDLQVGSVSKFKIASTGDVTIGGITLGSNSTVYALNIAASNFTTTSNNATLTLNPRIFDGSPGNARTAVAVTPTTISHSSGLWNTFAINSTYTQSGTAASTDLLINRTETSIGSGTQLLLDAQVGGVSKFSVGRTGVLNALSLTFTGIIQDSNNGTNIDFPSNGVITFFSNGSTDFNRIQLGGTTNLFPSIKRNGAAIDFRLADDSGFCAISAAQAVFTNTFVSILFSPSYYESTGVKQWLSVANTTAACSFKTTSLFADSGTINASARVQIDSTTQGFLPPRMTTAQKTGIVSPATGLVVFDTDLGKLCVFAVTWQTITSV